jgi:hypothetical protein
VRDRDHGGLCLDPSGLLLVPERLIDTADGQTPKVAFTAD